METVCLFREPTTWLESWWRYRARVNIPNKEHSTRELDFERFVQIYINGRRAPANVGRQACFVSDRHGNIVIDHLFAYEQLNACIGFLCDRMEIQIELSRSNVSPPAHADPSLTPKTRALLEAELATDFAIHRSLIEQRSRTKPGRQTEFRFRPWEKILPWPA